VTTNATVTLDSLELQLLQATALALELSLGSTMSLNAFKQELALRMTSVFRSLRTSILCTAELMDSAIATMDSVETPLFQVFVAAMDSLAGTMDLPPAHQMLKSFLY